MGTLGRRAPICVLSALCVSLCRVCFKSCGVFDEKITHHRRLHWFALCVLARTCVPLFLLVRTCANMRQFVLPSVILCHIFDRRVHRTNAANPFTKIPHILLENEINLVP